jgi:hypothetical protein
LVQPIGEHLDDLRAFHVFALQAQATNAALLAIAELRLLDHLDAGAADAAEVAARGGLNIDNVARVLRFLAAQQVIECDSAHRYSHTARSRLLQENQSSLRFFRESMGAAEGMAECLKTGKPAFDCRYGKSVFEHLAENPDALGYFGDLMTRTTAILEAFLFANHVFEPFDLAVDVGGSHGRLMIQLLDRHPASRGVVFDLPDTAARAAGIIAASPVADRIEVIGGDFFEAVPNGGDLYLLKQILHDWADQECVRILSSIRGAIAGHGRVAVIEYILPNEPEPHAGFAMDIQIMTLSTGRERTADELEALLGTAGFRVDRVTANPHGPSIVEAVRA